MRRAVGSSRVRFLLTGTYSSWNKGDAAMQLTMATRLRERLGDRAEITISSPFPTHDTLLYSDTNVVSCGRRNGWRILSQLTSATIHWAWVKLTRREPRWLPIGEELQATRDADLVIDLSGDMLTEDYGALVGFSHLIPLLQASLLGTPYMICAQSIGPFGLLLSPLARLVIANATLVTIREDESRQQVDGYLDTAETTADMAFLLESNVPSGLAEFLDGLESSGLTVGLSLSRIVKDRFELRNDQADFYQVLAQAIDEALDGREAVVALIPHVTGPTPEKDDRLVLAELQERLRTPSLLLEAELTPPEVKWVISKCDAFVGARMHANIAALSSCVPVLAMSYSHKSIGIMGQVGQRDMVIDGETMTVEYLRERLTSLIEERHTRSDSLSLLMPSILKKSQVNVDLAVELATRGLRE